MNKNLLEYEIKKNGKTIGDFCNALSISKSAYYRKVSQKSEFTQKEIISAMVFLNLESPVDIFFTKQVS